MSEDRVSEDVEFIREGPGRPQPPDEPLADVLYAALVQHADLNTVAQIDPSSGAELKFSELLAESVRAAEGLRSHRLGPGHVVLVCCDQVSDLYPAVLGAVFAGTSVLPVDPSASPGDIKTLMTLCKPRALFAEPRTLARVHTALQGLARQPPVIVLNQDDVPARLVRAGDIAFDDLVHAVPTASPASFAPPPIPSLDGHVPLIVPTAASPNKAAMLSNKRALVLLDLFREVVPDAVAAAATDVVLASLPLSKAVSLLALLRCCWAGHTWVSMCEPGPQPQPLQVLAVLEKYRVTRWIATPGNVNAASTHAAAPKFNLTALGTVLVTGEGESMPAKEQSQAREALGARIQPLYCVTEMGLLLLSKDGVPGSVGTVCPTVSIKIVDTITGETLGPDEEGELRAKSKSALKGYVGDPEGTAALFDDEGWFCTGDVMRYDADGHFFFVEKMSDSIECAGSMVSARELENVIRTHPAVRDVAVLGRPDPDDGELPMAFVVLESEQTITKQDIINLVKEKLPEGKHLRGGVEFLDSLPRSTSGKLSSRQLRDRMPRRSVVGSLLQM